MNQSQAPLSQPPPEENLNLDPAFRQEVERLHRVSVHSRWLVISILWLTIGLVSLWHLRSVIFLLMENFTWVAVRYGVIYNLLPALGLVFCISMTIAVLVWQSRNILFGRPCQEQRRLEQQVLRIRNQGPSHPLWQQICQKQQVDHEAGRWQNNQH